MELVKVGGSLCRPEWQPPLLDWLEARARAGPVLVVCGGGAFADAVRSEQRRVGYGALTAHRQALLAMEQTAWWLHAAWHERHGRCCPVVSDGRPGSLWTPRDLIQDSGELAASWEVTSDTLAAWLAQRCAATHLHLLKSLAIGYAQGTTQDWAQRGWVDASFPDYARRAGCKVDLLGRAAWADAGLSGGAR
jgi:aspartokinase-like uncharacterized kinase